MFDPNYICLIDWWAIYHKDKALESSLKMISTCFDRCTNEFIVSNDL